MCAAAPAATTTARSTTTHRARLAPAAPGDPALRAGRLFDLGITGSGLDRRDRRRRRGPHDAHVREDRHRPGTGSCWRSRTRIRPTRRRDAARARASHRVPEPDRAPLRGARDTREGGLVLRRHRGQGARDRGRDRRRHRDRQHPAGPRHEDHRDAAHVRARAGREPRGGRRPGSARRWTTSRRCCWARCAPRAAC